MTKSWGIIKHITNRKQKPHIQTSFKIGNYLITSDKNIICNRFNAFFVDIRPTLVKSIPKVDESPLSYMGNRLIESIYLQPGTENEIITLIKALKDTETGFDNMNSMSLKIFLQLWSSQWPISAICLLMQTSIQMLVFSFSQWIYRQQFTIIYFRRNST